MAAFKPLLDGIRASRFYQVMNRQQRHGSEQSTDSWDRFFNLTRQMHEAGMDVSGKGCIVYHDLKHEQLIVVM